MSGKEWYKNSIRILQEDLEYYSIEHGEECRRVNERNKWIDELISSLK